MAPAKWQFFIDVGGTFTDIVARRPDGQLRTHKLLSSGAVRGVVEPGSTTSCVVDAHRIGEPQGLWVGYQLAILPSDGDMRCEAPSAVGKARPRSAHVVHFDAATGRLRLDSKLEALRPVNDSQDYAIYELRGPEDAPLLAIRHLMGLRLNDSIGAVDVRLGTTRATNALLERKGANVALVTTKGFADILKIGYQDRPKLFELNITKRRELAGTVIEVDERLSVSGQVLCDPDERVVSAQLERAKAAGIEALAICLLHAHVNPVHEEVVDAIARRTGFAHVSVSSRVARLERIVPRGDTTVVDAYLSPVIEDYVRSLQRSMPEARIRLMTSSGGLIDASAVRGKDTILSGPAGGVIGGAYVSRQADISRSIAFDMGGTSTDVSRIDAQAAGSNASLHGVEYQHETVKAGVRIVTPMLAIETVAAGGGSICAFDGQKLTVGPQSAGATPGPACYGRGGPLTVTDANVFLGRVVADYFPFHIDRTVVEKKLVDMSDQISRAARLTLSPLELAEGFIKIANANMASAIKRISLAKGYDVRKYTLMPFGGAGGQHACAIARMLGITRVLCNPFAGVLSAVGMGAADVQRIGERSVNQPLDSTCNAAIEPIFASITADLTATLEKEGVCERDLARPARSMDLCYTGQATFITVPAEPLAKARHRFEQMHKQLYGYIHSDRPVEVRAVRVELRAPSEPVAIEHHAKPTLDTPPLRMTPMVVHGRSQPVPLHLRGELESGQHIIGPAIVIEDTSTIVIEPDWEATVTDRGDIILEDANPVVRGATGGSEEESISTEVDPIQLELFNNRFAGIAERMGTVLRRTALSVNVKERLDFSCAVFTASGDLVVNAPHIPVHLGGMSHCVKVLLDHMDRISAGDVYVTNDPYQGGSHLNDVTVITPVHDDADRRLLFFVASRAHHAEIGGTRPGSMPPDSTTLAEEGVVIRATRWIEAGKPQHARLRKLLTDGPYPSRTPDENLADIAAQTAANQTGAGELIALVNCYGVDVVHAYMRHIQDAAEAKMRTALRKLQNGVHRFEDQLDDGTIIKLAIAIAGDRATLDFSGTDAVHEGNLNANRAIVSSATLYCLRCLIDEDIPLNAGVLAPIDMIVPPCFLNPPPHADPAQCAAVVGGNVETSQRIVDCIFGALKIVAAGQGTMNNLLMGTERFGFYETICGGAGAGPGFDGADAVHTHMTNTRMTDPEILESRVPVRLIRFAIRHGSGGRGKHNGGCGVVREIEFLEPLEVSIISQRRTTAPYGLCGGEAGQRGRNTLYRAGSVEKKTLGPIAMFLACVGDRLVIETPGGGGYGKRSHKREL